MYDPHKARIKASVMKALEHKRDELIAEYIWDAETPQHCHVENGKVVLDHVDMLKRRCDALSKVNQVFAAFDEIESKYMEIFNDLDKES